MSPHRFVAAGSVVLDRVIPRLARFGHDEEALVASLAMNTRPIEAEFYAWQERVA